MNTLSTKYKYFYGENNAEKMPHKQSLYLTPTLLL